MLASELGREIRDGDWTLLKWDPQTGKSTWVKYEDDGRVVVRTDTPVHKTIEENTAFRNATPDGWKGDWHRVASIPMNLLYDDNLGLMEAHAQGDDRYLRRWLNDSDNRAWRTKEGRI